MDRAQPSSARELESQIRESRRAAACAPEQGALLPADPAPLPAPAPKVQLSFTLELEQHARWLAIVERLRKLGHAEPKDELLLAAFDALAEAECKRVQNEAECTRVQSEPPYQVVIFRCEDCGAARLADRRALAPGCHSTRFLEVHHRAPRQQGGRNSAANLITLCSACHRLLHESGRELAAALPVVALPNTS